MSHTMSRFKAILYIYQRINIHAQKHTYLLRLQCFIHSRGMSVDDVAGGSKVSAVTKERALREERVCVFDAICVR